MTSRGRDAGASSGHPPALACQFEELRLPAEVLVDPRPPGQHWELGLLTPRFPARQQSATGSGQEKESKLWDLSPQLSPLREVGPEELVPRPGGEGLHMQRGQYKCLALGHTAFPPSQEALDLVPALKLWPGLKCVVLRELHWSPTAAPSVFTPRSERAPGCTGSFRQDTAGSFARFKSHLSTSHCCRTGGST